jgi:hypothetical protein
MSKGRLDGIRRDERLAQGVRDAETVDREGLLEARIISAALASTQTRRWVSVRAGT